MSTKKPTKKKPPKELVAVIDSVVMKVRKEYGEEGVKALVATGKLPPLKLSKTELSAVAGGQGNFGQGWSQTWNGAYGYN